MYKGLKYALSLAVTLFISAAFAFSQVTGGAVTGTIADTNGAIIPNVTVRLADKVRGQVFTTQTTDTGSFLYPNVPVGEYTLTVEQSGFEKATKDLTVTLNQTTTLDATLQVAGGSNVVDVIAGGDAIVQSDSSQLGTSFGTRKVEDLPGSGNTTNLALLAPNVVPRSAGSLGSGGSVGGVRPRGNTFNVDGVDNNDSSVTGPSAAVIQDAVEEFTLLQNNFNAEFGAGAGGQFNTITKSGTNSFRGRAFTYIDSQQFNARSTLEDGREKDFFKQARWGGALGGPILKNKLFFFGAYERFFLEQPGAVDNYFAPTSEGLNQIAAIPGVSPFVVALLRNNLTLPTAADPQATAELGTVLGVSGIPFGNVILPIPGSQSGHSFQVNIDHLPNEENQFRYRFGYDRQRVIQAGGGGLKFNNAIAFDSRLFSANWVRTINANLINDLRLSYKSAIDDRPLVDPSVTDFPNLTINSLNLALGPNGNLPQGTPIDDNYQIYDALTLVHGAHTFKFGAEMRRLLSTSSFLPRARGDYQYSEFDILLQDLKPDAVDIRGVGSPNFVGNRYQFFFFGQDDWKIRQNLTLNLGLRYEYASLPRDAASQELNSISSVPGVIEFNRPKTDANNFAPRIGFAWSPTWDNSVGRILFGKQGESALRANFAVAHFVNFQNLLLLNLPPQFAQENNGGGPDTLFLQSGAIPNILLPSNTPELARAATGSIILDQITPYTLSWALSYQRQITREMGIEFRYLHTNSRKLPVQVQLNGGLVREEDLIIPTFFNQPTAGQLAGLPTLGTIAANSPTIGVRSLTQYGFGQNSAVTGFPNIGESWYNGASVSLTRRFSRGFGLTAAYTFSKTMDNSTNELNSSALNPRRPQDGFNIDDEVGLSALDVPHRFVTSFNYDLTAFDKVENRIARAFLTGWQANGIFQIQSGQPITIRSGIDSNQNLDA
ncbi:MAG: TonB-dependent receptor, partial [Saprospiraceae bacterium]|nr:TonB-dependent receptor [Pyrinomonadaceae bacterium]